MTDQPPDRSQLPATSLAVVLGLTAVLVWRLSATAGVGRLTLVGAGAGLAVALSLWLVGWERWRAVGTVLASLLVAPVSVGVLAASVGTVTLAARGALSLGSLGALVVTILATLFVTVGCVVAVFGAAAASRGVLDLERARRYATVANRTVLPLALVGGALFASDLSAFSGDGSGLFGVQRAVATTLAAGTGVLFDPAPGRTHLAVFSLLVGLTAVAVGRGVRALPLTELAPATDDWPDVAGAVERTVRWLTWGGVVLLVLVAPVVGALELGTEQAAIRSLVPPALYELTATVTGLSALRVLLWRLLLASLAVALAVWLLRRAVRSSADRVGTVLAPYAGGTALALVVFAVAEPVVARTRTAIAGTAPAPVARVTEQLLTSVLELFGAGTVLVLVALVDFSTASVVGTGLWLALVTRYVTERTAGAAVAAGGLFVASAFAATLGASTVLVLAGLVGAIVVWDAGAFGTRLRREAGPAAATRRAELVHTGGTLAVGGVGAVLTVALRGVVTNAVTVTTDAALAGLAVCLVAVAALVFAMR